MINKSLKKKIEIALIATFLSLLTLKDFIGIGVPSLAFTAVWILLILIADHDTSAAFTLGVVICFASTLSITIPSAFFILWTIIKHHKQYTLHMVFWVSCSVALIEFFRFLLVPNESFRLYVNSMVVVLLVVTVITGLSNKICDPVKCIKMYLGFYLFLTLDIIWATARALGGIGQIISSSFRIGQVELADENVVGLLGVNSNGIALFSILAIAFSLVLLNKKRIKLWAVLCITAYSTVVGLLTVSKTFVLVYVGFWTLYVVWYIIKNGGNIFKPIVLICVIAVALIVISQTSMAQNVIDRFIEGYEKGDLATGRADIIYRHLTFMSQDLGNMLYGVGLQNLIQKTGIDVVPHNAILEIYVCLGLIGVVLYFIFFIFLVKMGRKFIIANNETNGAFITLIPFIIYIVFIQGVQFIRINYIYALIALIFSSMVVLSRENTKKPDKIEEK